MQTENTFTRGINPLVGDRDRLWSSPDEQSSENEVSEFLWGLVRALKPEVVVETGCYLGDATLAIAGAMKLNGFGMIYSCDTEQERVKEVQRKLEEKGLQDFAQVVLAEGTELIRMVGGMVDFAFIDSSPDGKIRGAEIDLLLTYLRPLKMFALHDVAPQHSTIRAVYEKLDMPKVYLNTPRGLALFQKP